MSYLGSIFSLPVAFFTTAEPADGGVFEQAPVISVVAEDKPLGDQPSSSSPLQSSAGRDGSGDTATLRTREEPEQQGAASGTLQPEGEPAGTTCNTCCIGFSTGEEQRAHFRSDWHRLNMKRRLRGHAALSEEQFEELLGDDNGDVSSISGSSSDEEEDQQRLQRHRNPQTVFRNADGKLFAVWQCLLGPQAGKAGDGAAPPATAVLDRLAQLRTQTSRWAVILSGGGHFAAAIFDLKPPRKERQPKDEVALFEVVAHKTFHRYVVRAKAGGRQSAKDNTGKFAKSAGSQIRRQNEAALEADIRETLNGWKPQLGRDALLFVHAPSANAAAIFGGEGAPLQRSDPRIRGVPFTTRRPTLAETKRVARMLLSVYEPTPVTADGLRKPKVQVSQKASSVKAAQPESEQDAEDVSTPSVPQEPDQPLHTAAGAGDAEKVWQLLEAGADPTLRGQRGKSAYALAASKEVRDVFRRYMAKHPDEWDYNAAGVPSALTDDMEQQQEQKRAEKKARQREKEKERKKGLAERKARAAEDAKLAAAEEVSRAASEAAAIASRGRDVGKGPKKLSAEQVQQERERAAAEKRRELMAAAAEARLNALQLASSQQQLW